MKEKKFSDATLFIGNLTQGLSSAYQKRSYGLLMSDLNLMSDIDKLIEENPDKSQPYKEIRDTIETMQDEKYADVNQALQVLQARISKNVTEMLKDKTIDELAQK